MNSKIYKRNHFCVSFVMLKTRADGTPDELRGKDPSGKLDVVFRKLTMEGEVK